MKLYYRGLSYEYESSKFNSNKIQQPFQPVPQTATPYNLIYRGLTYRIDPNSQSAEVPLAPLTYQLNFRGITYCVNKTAQAKVTIASQPTSIAKVGTLPSSQELKLQQ